MMNKIIFGFNIVAVSVVSCILFGFIFTFGWSIFIVPTFGVAYISLPVAMAMVHLVTVPFAPHIMNYTIDQKMVGTDATPMTRLLCYAFSIVIYAIITAIYYFVLMAFM